MKNKLRIEDYAEDISLFEDFTPTVKQGTKKEELVDSLLVILKRADFITLEYSEKRAELYGIINTLPPYFFRTEQIEILDNLLQLELQEKHLIEVNDLHGKRSNKIGNTEVVIWKGDISTLRIDAIVNAANNRLLGCFQPHHKCIDNVIQSAAGVRLRDDCSMIMEKQGVLEETGRVKVTRAYNLPSKFIMHTVGPIVKVEVTDVHKKELSSSYTSCLNACKELPNVRSIAFCCISTGVYGYPQAEAAKVAYETVTRWITDNPSILDTVIFNVFTDADSLIYENLREKV